MGFECSAEPEAGGTVMKREKCTAIVLAAGQGTRMRSKIQKQFLLIKGNPVLYYSLACFQNTDWVDDIILVASVDSIEFCRRDIVQKYGLTKVSKIIAGGKERYDSVYQGLLACEGCDYVFIHDGARPFITEEILSRALNGARCFQACVVGMPSKDTIKISDEEGMIAATPDRRYVWTIQTPQVFRYSLIREAHEELRKGDMQGITDDAMVVEKTKGCRIKLVEGSYENIKITTPEDLMIAENFVEKI